MVETSGKTLPTMDFGAQSSGWVGRSLHRSCQTRNRTPNANVAVGHNSNYQKPIVEGLFDVKLSHTFPDWPILHDG